MENYFLWAGMALCLFSLWALARYDWLRLTRPSRRVMGRVIGHRTGWDEGSKNYAAIYAFSDESGAHEVIDSVYSGSPRPSVGTLRELAYPAGRPELARPPRLALWLSVYAMLMALAAILFAKWMGWLQ
jgi:hypothetical protein